MTVLLSKPNQVFAKGIDVPRKAWPTIEKQLQCVDRSRGPPSEKEKCTTLDARASAIEHFHRIYSELTALHIELKESDIEIDAPRILRHTVDQMRKTASALVQGVERFGLSSNNQPLLTFLVQERLLRASELNASITKQFESGQIRTDQYGLSTYVRVLNQIIQELDRMLGSLTTEP